MNTLKDGKAIRMLADIVINQCTVAGSINHMSMGVQVIERLLSLHPFYVYLVDLNIYYRRSQLPFTVSRPKEPACEKMLRSQEVQQVQPDRDREGE